MRAKRLMGIALAAGVVAGAGLFLSLRPALAQPLPGLELRLSMTEEPGQVVGTLRLLLLLTLLALVPAILLLTTSFTRIIIVLSFVRSALATQQVPPNQVLIGLALFLTFFTMAPVYNEIKTQALDPYLAGQISQEEAWDRGSKPLREFMYRQTREKDLALFIRMAGLPDPRTREDVPLYVLIPAFVLSELKTAFQMGFLIYIPFLIIDLVVASTLMAMGMFMVPPIMISLPFKLMLFVLVDGWYLVVKSLLESF
ncbi:MAG: flagellar type III secretion system pore protein FliP [Thermanaeromonas sp.]|uniref:flagellar type III secretion system pore protein FliP n=1 Tax=Thermanaeromonas sp. TaxID=2003697 RepID=UPI0024400E01|nr:flagellar type III secretion system pore protein FliP [Thermanaeromonas sp.]MCG0278128.1 flagellar type III secretion system pore protein FliP [Thermanaeromonas sp.]